MRAAALFTLALLAAGPVAAQPAISLVPVAQGLGRIVAVAHAGDGSSRLFLTRQTGQILILEGGAVLPRRSWTSRASSPAAGSAAS
jgi:hypothetical protein